MKHLKIVSKGFETYTGNLGGVDFVDGMSAHPVPRVFANRLTAAMQMVEVGEDGVEEDAGVAHRLIAESMHRAPVIEPLQRQTEEEKVAENIEIVTTAVASDVTIYSREELETILEKDGIKGLRSIAEHWKVKDRSAVKLLEMILSAQSAYAKSRDERIAALAGIEKQAGEAADEPSEDQTSADETPEKVSE